MKKRFRFLALGSLVLFLLFGFAFAAETPAPKEEEPILLVSSESITADGRLLTVTAANRNPNRPKGENQSPQLTFSAVEDATCYVIVMFDTKAKWLHALVTDVTETELAQGAYTNTKQYIGPYPPKGTGSHPYRIEVFALKAAPDKVTGKMNAKNSYEKIVSSLDTANGEEGNILLRVLWMDCMPMGMIPRGIKGIQLSARPHRAAGNRT